MYVYYQGERRYIYIYIKMYTYVIYIMYAEFDYINEDINSMIINIVCVINLLLCILHI